MRQSPIPRRALALPLAVAMALAAASPSSAQTVPTEGYDPLRQITAQLVKANLLLVQDVSGSMVWDKYGNNVGNDAHGRLSWESTLSNVRSTSRSRSDGRLQFIGRQSNGTVRTVEDTDFRGARNPGVYTWAYSSTGAPTYSCNRNVDGCPSTTTDLTATQFPVLLFNSSQSRWEPAYRCRPTGSWRQSELELPWAPGTYVWEAGTFDLDECTLWSSGLYFTYPSRMMNVKNALGNSVYIADDYTPPNPGLTGEDKWKDVVWASGLGAHVAKETTAAGEVLVVDEAYRSMKGNTKSWRFNINTGFDLATVGVYNPAPTGTVTRNLAVKVNWVEAPTDLFPAYHESAPASYLDSSGVPVRSPGLTSGGSPIAAGSWAIGWVTDPARYGTMSVRAPGDVIGRNAERINFGLSTYSGEDDASYPFLFPIDTRDTNNVERLQGYLAAREAPDGTDVYTYVPKQQYPILTDASNMERVRIGLSGSGSTPTRNALQFAKKILDATFSGGTIAAEGKTWTLPADPKKDCLRTYGVVLVTDGMSNNGNPGDDNWLSPCGTVAGRNDCDGGDSGYDCPRNWTEFAAQAANDIYTPGLTQTDGTKINPRVWAIGISSAVGPCELDFIAYMGRTDASSPSGDAGFGGYHSVKNPRLPNPAVAVKPNPVNGNAGTYDGPTGNRYWSKDTSKTYRAPSDEAQVWWPTPPPAVTGTGHNAFFANDAAELGEAFATIVNATAAGDYATNAPVSGMSAAASNMVFLPSTSFPNWNGHLYAFDTNKEVTDPLYLAWDAGDNLNAMPSASRKIFTWNPADNALVEIKVDNLGEAPLNAVPGLDAQVIDFIRGNDGSGSPRAWRLGPMINSTPAIVGAPAPWVQNKVVDHKPFQIAAGGRDALLWVGSNDGMLHAFRATDGIEQIAILPPSLLSTQVTLFNNYVADPGFSSGQPPDILNHIYGVSNSLRFGDVYFASEGTYKTVGIVTLGGGGSDVFAVDVTSIPRPEDPDYATKPNISVLWKKSSGASSTDGVNGTLAQLGQAFSIPAFAPASSNTWRLIGGSGFRPENTVSAQKSNTNFVDPKVYVLDPMDGRVVQTKTLPALNKGVPTAPQPFVGSQAFADSVLFDPKAKGWQDDNVAILGLQADLNGRIWFVHSSSSGSLDFDQATVGIDVSTDIAPSQSQPIYFNPAASGYGDGVTAGCVAYAFGSGALYERSASITGSGVGTHPAFVPRLYIATGQKSSFSGKLPGANVSAKPIAGVWTVENEDGTTSSVTFGKRTQLTGPPFMLVPKSGKGTSTALFLLYDPDVGCNGFSYVAVAEFEGDSSCRPGTPTWKAFPAGVGAASGFTIAGDKVLVSKSGIGEGERAGLYVPPNISAAIGGTAVPKVRWWKELK